VIKIVENKKIEEIIKEILEAKHPINLNSENLDLSDFIEVFSDGKFNSRGYKYFYNPKTKQLLGYNWSNWQGEENSYRKSTLKEYMGDMMSTKEENHFDRYVEGLKLIFNPPEHSKKEVLEKIIQIREREIKKQNELKKGVPIKKQLRDIREKAKLSKLDLRK